MNRYKYIKERFSSIFAPGIKMWSNGLPLKADTYQSCMNFCRYCYANELRQSTLSRIGIKQNLFVARTLDLKKTAKFFENAYNYKDEKTPFMNWAIRNKYFIELGTTGETFQDADEELRVSYNFIKLMSEYKMPLFINTKLNLICTSDDFQKLLIEYKAPIVICLTLTTEDDKLGKIYEPCSPLPSQRLKTIKELNKYDHIKTIVYTSPFMPGVTNKNTKEYIQAIIEAGIISAHLRDFYMQGKIFQNKFWKKYIKENKKDLEAFFGGYHTTYQARKDFIIEAQDYATKLDPNFTIVGVKSMWFEQNPYHGKMNYDILPDRFKEGVTDFTAIPLMRKIRDNKELPQLLSWGKLGYKEDKINLPKRIRSNEGDINNLMSGVCNCNTSDFDYEMTGIDWLTDGMWNGWKGNKPSGFLSTLDYIFPVKDGKHYAKDSNGNYLYAYLPKDKWGIVKDGGQNLLFIPESTKNMKEPYIQLKDTKGFLEPEREGGTEDKWLK